MQNRSPNDNSSSSTSSNAGGGVSGNGNSGSNGYSGGNNVTFHPNTTDNRSHNMQNGDYVEMFDKCTDILHKVQKHVQNT